MAEPMTDAVSRELLLAQTNDAYEALRADDAAWREELGERALWETTVSDGMEADLRDTA